MKQLPAEPVPQLADKPNQLTVAGQSPSQSGSDDRQAYFPKPSRRWSWFKQLRRPLLWSGAGIVIAVVLINAFKPQPVLVETAIVKRGDLQATVNAEGKTRIQDQYLVAAPVSGRLQRVALEVGDPVAAGDVVARLDPLPLDTSIQQTLSQLQEWQAQRAGVQTQRPKAEALAQARAQIEAAKANQAQAQFQVTQAQATLDQALRDRQRDRDLAAAGAISEKAREASELEATTRQKEFDTARMAATAAAAQVKVAQTALEELQAEQADPDYLLRVYDAKIASAKAELARLRYDAAQTLVRSPVTGRVLSITHKSTQFLTEGTPILSVGNLSNLELVIDVLSRDAETINPGDPILIAQGDDQSRFSAQVKRIEPAAFTKVSALGVEEQRVNVIGAFNALPKTLGDGYRLDTRIVVWEGENRLQVPLSALFRCQTDWCVFTQRQNIAQRQKVKLGQRSRLMAEVQAGLQSGDVVILHPTDQVRDGVLTQTKTEH